MIKAGESAYEKSRVCHAVLEQKAGCSEYSREEGGGGVKDDNCGCSGPKQPMMLRSGCSMRFVLFITW